MTVTKSLSEPKSFRACRQWRQPTEASRGRADLRIQGRAGDVRHADVGARGAQGAQTAGDLGSAVGVVRPVVVVDRGRAIETGRV